MCQNSKFLVHSHMFFFHSRILLNWKTMILERFSDLTWGPAHCTPLTRIVPRLLLLYSIPSIHNYRNVVIRTGSWTAAYVCFVYACCLYCCVNLPLVPFCMFASFACFDSVNLEGSCVAFESCNDTDWLLGLFCMFASFACFDSVNLEGSCVAFESCNDTDWLLGVTRLTLKVLGVAFESCRDTDRLLGHRGASLITSKKAVRPGAPWKLPYPPRAKGWADHQTCIHLFNFFSGIWYHWVFRCLQCPGSLFAVLS